MERNARHASISGGSLGDSLTAALRSENHSSSSVVIGFFTGKGNRSQVEPHIRHLGIIHPNLFCNLVHHLYRCNLSNGDGNLHLTFTEIFPHALIMYHTWIRIYLWAKKIPENDSSTLLVIIFGKNSAKYVSLFFWTKKNNLRTILKLLIKIKKVE